MTKAERESAAKAFASIGGYARAKKLTRKQRSESARKASMARWAKEKKTNGSN